MCFSRFCMTFMSKNLKYRGIIEKMSSPLRKFNSIFQKDCLGSRAGVILLKLYLDLLTTPNIIPKRFQNDPQIIPNIFQNAPKMNPQWPYNCLTGDPWAAHMRARTRAHMGRPWVARETIVGSLWIHFGSILEYIWDNLGIILKSFGDNIGGRQKV